VQAHKANSHANRGWERFTQRVIDAVVRTRQSGVVFLSWGLPAQKRTLAIEKSSRHLVLKSVHPSPLSASRGFFDCGHFRKTNEWLQERYGEDGKIDWNLDVSPDKAGV
jgi:uracil-DNA glycosylase